MISLALWFAVLSSGGVLCTAVWKRKYEEVLPITCSVIVLILFLFGVAGRLLFGTIIVCLMGFAAYGVAAGYIIRKKELKLFAQNFFTTGFAGFVVVFICATLFNYGRMTCVWDEFSHWADIVKVMASLNDFGTNPNSQSLFQSYPPGMSLFQYFLQKLYQWTEQRNFSEWRLYLSYQIFVFAFILPFFKEYDIKKPLKWFTSLVALFLSPLPFYETIYSTIYIDPFLGILTGTGLATIFLCKEKDTIYSLRVLLTVSMLVLAKDAGLLFAVVLAIAYVLDYICGCKSDSNKSKLQFINKQYLCVPMAIFAIGIPKFLWKLHLEVTEARIVFSKPYDFARLLEIVLDRNAGYQRHVLKYYFVNLFNHKVSFGFISINYYLLMFFLLGFVAALCLAFGKKDKSYYYKNRIMFSTVCILFVAYIVGLCLTYVFKFTESEAIGFASFIRYVNIVYFAVWLFCMLVLLGFLQNYPKRTSTVEVLILVVIMIVSPLEYAQEFIQRVYVDRSVEIRAQYDQINNEIAKISERSRIYFISQESDGFDYWVMKYNSRPNFFNPNFTWSVREASYDGEAWTRIITPEEWQAELVDSYDYVALYKVNDYFREHFGSLFLQVHDISDNSLYRINKETGLLEKCR